MAITAQDVNKLRQQTGAGIMACKQALIEAGGDFDKAIDILRKQGQKLSAARADRTATEGIVLAQTNEAYNQGFILALSCETDFVAKNEAFQQLGQTILRTALAHQPATLAALVQLEVAGHTIQEHITALVAQMGEKIAVSSYETLSSEVVAFYIHTGSKLGVLVGLQGGQGTSVIEAGQDIAMQIAAMNPLAIDKDGIDAALVERELAIGRAQASNEGRPAAMVEKIAQGKVQKFFKENTLLGQAFIKDNALTVAQYLAKVAPTLTVASFQRISVSA